jgi:hypothetical protein
MYLKFLNINRDHPHTSFLLDINISAFFFKYIFCSESPILNRQLSIITAMHFSRISMSLALLSALASALPLDAQAYGQHTDDNNSKRAQAYGQHTDDNNSKRAQAYGQHTDDNSDAPAEAYGQHTDDVIISKRGIAQAYGQHTDDNSDAPAEAYGQHTDDVIISKRSGAQAYGQHTDDNSDAPAEAYGQHTDDSSSKRAQ